MTDWQHQQQQDEQQLRGEILEALAAAMVRPLTVSEAQLLGWATGVGQDFTKEIRL